MPNMLNVLLIAIFGCSALAFLRRIRSDYPDGMLTRRYILDLALAVIGFILCLIYTIMRVSLVKPMQLYLSILFVLWFLDCFYLSSFHRFLNKPILPKSKDTRRFQ